MKRLYNFMLAVLLIVMLSACGKQLGTDSSADKVSGQYVQTESAETTEQAEQEQPAATESIQTGTHTENNVANGGRTAATITERGQYSDRGYFF